MTRRTSDLLMAVLAVGTLAIFFGILVYRLPRLDLSAIVGITFLLAFYDFFLSSTRVGRS